jgi:hypothetical protein
VGKSIPPAVLAPVHDAVLLESTADRIEREAAFLQDLMRRASRVVLGGHELRTDADIVCWPDHYTDDRGDEIWILITGLLDTLEKRKRTAESCEESFLCVV